MTQDRVNALLRRLRQAGISEHEIELRLFGSDAQRRDLLRRERAVIVADIRGGDEPLAVKAKMLCRLLGVQRNRAYVLLRSG